MKRTRLYCEFVRNIAFSGEEKRANKVGKGKFAEGTRSVTKSETKTKTKKMAKRVCENGRKILSVLAILLNFMVIQKIDGYVLKRPESTNQPRNSAADNKDGPVPSCTNATFCVETPYYPTDLVDVLLRGNDLKYLATVDEPVEPYRQEFGTDGEALCSSQEMVVTPKTALSIGGLWLYVVNYEEYVQAVRVEICWDESRSCKFIDGFADGWTSVCKQTYVYRQMVAVTRDGRIAPQLFKLPSSCKCFVKYTGDPFTRLGKKINKGKRIKDSSKQRSQ